MAVFEAVRKFGQFYAWACFRVAYRFTLGCLFHPRATFDFCGQILNIDDLGRPCPVLRSSRLGEVFPAYDEITILGRYWSDERGGTGLLFELAALACACQYLQPKVIFEFGTFVGRTGRILLLNSPLETRLYTLDLPPERCSHVPGQDLRGTPEESRATFLAGDSNSFDFDPWENAVDLVWVDGCHDYETVAQDTANALKIVAPGGWILWHDYRHTHYWDGPTKFLRQLKIAYPDLTHILGTTIVALHVRK